jgi:hypothetical protein
MYPRGPRLGEQIIYRVLVESQCALEEISLDIRTWRTMILNSKLKKARSWDSVK